MKISQLIDSLEDLHKTHGDMEVKAVHIEAPAGAANATILVLSSTGSVHAFGGTVLKSETPPPPATRAPGK